MLDAVLAAAVFAFALSALAHGRFEPADRDLDALGGLLVALSAWPLAARRLAPLAVFVLVTASTSALYGLGYGLGPPVAFAVALYTFAEHRDEIRPRTWTVALLASLVVLLGPHAVQGEWGPELLLGSVVWAAAWFAGDRARLRRDRLAQLEERARAEERTRIARDLHDSAGHAINVILVQAGAARLLHEREPERARQALETIEEVARDTLADIEQLVHALRENGSSPGVEPPPGLAALETLVDRHRASGLAVTVSVRGARRPLAPGVDQAAYRIVQEGLTNAARHGRGSANVELEFGPAGLEVVVTNPAAAPESSGRGQGLVGMHERAELLGGSLEAGSSDGLFRVRARLPYGGGEA